METKIPIKIPGNLRSNFQGYNQILRFINALSSVRGSEIIIDFKLVNFIEANLSAVLGVAFEILESNGNKVKLINLQSQVETILRKNELLTSYGYEPTIDYHQTTLPYKKFVPNNAEGFNDYITQYLLAKTEFPSHSEALGKEILRNIFEIFENARTHGDCEYIHTCGQFFPNREMKPLHFTIVDKGVNIQENVNKFLNEQLSAVEAIVWAMKKGNTTKTGGQPGGLGLNVIFEFIKLNNGKIHIISADGFYEFNKGEVETYKLNSPFYGTIVNICFNLNDKSYYSLKSESISDDIIF